MHASATVCSKGGVGKTTVAANLGGLLADAGFRVLLIDLDSQPTLSSYYELSQPAPGGVYELLATELVDLDPEWAEAIAVVGATRANNKPGTGKHPGVRHVH